MRERINQDAVNFEVSKKRLYVSYGFLCRGCIVAFFDGGEQYYDFFDAVLFLLGFLSDCDFLLNRLENDEVRVQL